MIKNQQVNLDEYRCDKRQKSVEARTPAPAAPAVATLSPRLSPRQKELVLLVVQEKSEKETAFLMGLTLRTVKAYMHILIHLVGARSRTGVALWGIKNLPEARAIWGIPTEDDVERARAEGAAMQAIEEARAAG